VIVMIMVVTLNPALDVTHHVTEVDWSGVNRPVAVRTRPGGKGLNVARTLHVLGADVLAVGLFGGITGEAVRSGLGEIGVPVAATGIAGETRRTFAVVDDRRYRTALFNEPGPTVSGSEYRRFLARYQKALPGCAAVVLSGSLPPGVAADSYAELTGMAVAASVPVVLDAEGQALLRGAPGRPAIVKPNLAELERSLGRPMSTAAGPDHAAVVGAARELMAAGAQSVVVSLGAAGLLAVTCEGLWQAAPPGEASGNPTGAGDAVVAGLAHGLVLGRSWAERLRHAVALGAATAAAPAAGEFRHADYSRMLAGVRIARCEAS
jgi:tagatose 6-phosphate kinase